MNLLKEGKTNWKYILFVVILATMVGGGILAWQYWGISKEEEVVENEMADWKIYSKTEYWGNKCEIKYPDNWEVKNVTHLTPKENRIPEDVWVTINCFPKEKGYINQNTGEDLLSLCQAGKFSLADTEKFEAVYSKEFCTLSIDGSQIGTAMFQVRDGRQRMDYYIPDDEFKSEFNVFNQMLSTFKFVGIDETANWKTYQNEEFEFEFKYPKEKFETAYRWPPVVTVVSASEDFKKACPDFSWDREILGDVNQKQKSISGIMYSIYVATEGAAGSVYEDHCYITLKNEEYFGLEFIVRYPNPSCGMFTEGSEEWAQCKSFDRVKDVEEPIEQIVSTFSFLE